MKFFKTKQGGPIEVRLPAADASISEIRLNPFEFGAITHAGSARAVGTCLHCPDTPCVSFSAEELQQPIRYQITSHPSADICVFGALSTMREKSVPQVDASRCTGCGLCVSRCPVGAIRIAHSGKVEVNDTESDVLRDAVVDDVAEFQAAISQLANVTIRQIPGANVLARQLEPRAADAIQGCRRAGNSRYTTTLLVRNLLLQVGFAAKAGPPGDTNSRVDVVFDHPGGVGLAEIELYGDLLSAIRRLLADIAVAHSRYGIPKEELLPAMVIGHLPNSRTDIYEVLGDVRSDLGVSIRVLSVGALLLFLWSGAGPEVIPDSPQFLLSAAKKEIATDVRDVLPVSRSIVSGPSFSAQK